MADPTLTIVKSEPSDAPLTIVKSEPQGSALDRMPGAAEFNRANQQFSQDAYGGVVDALNPMNIVKGAGQLLKAGAQAIDHPIDTFNAVRNAPYGEMARSAVDAVQSHPGAIVGQLTGAMLAGEAPRLAGRLMQGVAPKVMDAGLWRTGPQRIEFPNTPQRLVDEGIVPGGQRVANELGQTEQKVNTEAQAFDRLPNMGSPQRSVNPNALADSAAGFARTEGRVPGLGNVPGPEAQEIQQLREAYLEQNTRPRGLQETIDQKRSYQARANYDGRANAPTQTNNELNFNKGVAGANRAAAIGLHPELADDLAKEQDLLGARVAEQRTANRGTPLTIPGVVRSVTMSPTVMGGTAIGMDRLGQALSYGPTGQALRAAILARLASKPSEDTESR